MLKFAFFLVLVAPSYQSCPSCESCSSEAEGMSCNCDANCALFGDCCGSLSPPASCPPPSLPPLHPGAVFNCQPITENGSTALNNGSKGYLMVSSCPVCSEHAQGASELLDNCTSTKLTSFPPVTDINTGIVYRNQYCAYCNGVKDFAAWPVDLKCSVKVNGLLSSGNLSTLLNDTTILLQECQVSQYRAPSGFSNASLPRSCLVSTTTCLPITQLKEFMGPQANTLFFEMEHNCTSGLHNLVIGDDGTVYKNAACASCNAVNQSYCFNELRLQNGLTSVNKSSQSNDSSPFSISSVDCGTVQIIGTNTSLFINVECKKWETSLGNICADNELPTSVSEIKEICQSLSQTMPSNSSSCNLTLGNRYTTSIRCVDSSLCQGLLIPWNDNDAVVKEGLPTLYYDHDSNLYFCMYNPLAENFIFFFGNSLTLIGVLLIIITHVIFSEVRNIPSTIILNYVIPIFLTSLMYLLQEHYKLQVTNARKVFAIFYHYFSLVQFTWLAIFSYEILRKFVNGIKLKLDTKSSKKVRIIFYLIIGWSVGAIVVAVTVTVDVTKENLVGYGINGSTITHIEPFILAWALPAALLTIFSTILFGITSFIICKVAVNKSKLKQKANWTLMRLWIGTLIISGVPYVRYFITSPYWLTLVAKFYSYSEGLFIFAAFFLSKKIIRLYYKSVQTKVSHYNLCRFCGTIKCNSHWTSFRQHFSNGRSSKQQQDPSSQTQDTTIDMGALQ